MKNLLIALFLTLLHSGTTLPADFRSDFEEAINFLEEQEALLQEVAQEFPEHDAKAVLAIVSPELIRYQLFSDFFETKALELAYVSRGSEVVDFSIGRFQMKPSFIEEVEYHIHQHPLLSKKYQKTINYPAQHTEDDLRRLRLERLKNFEWQVRYAHLFYAIVNDCFSGFERNEEDDRLSLIATAYNYGFSRPVEEIRQYMKIQAFPYGPKFKTEQLSYGEWSQLFYQRL